MADDQQDDGDAVKVAVRVRPFNATDGDNPKCIVFMEGQTCTITNPATGEKKDFNFDYCFNTHWNGEGPKPHNYADQTAVWNALGVQILNNAFKGFNSCLFAYGQSGAGKSFSMTANPPDDAGKGIVPRAAREIFSKRDQNQDPTVQQTIEVQMVEIYNEKIRDLLRPDENPPDGLDLKEHPELGPTLYREREIWMPLPVVSEKHMFALLDEGVANMTKAATNLNKASSRAHTVFSLIYTYRRVDPATQQALDVRRATINLVDLAGSERVAKTGTSAGSKEFKEGVNINRSLTCLGQVIETLGKNAAKRAKGQKEDFVKYRDSKLTLMLKESLGGNSRTIMIAALRPNDANFDETVSTLRYASSAKLIQNKSKVNTTDPKIMVKKLQAELEEMKRQLALAKQGGGGGGGGQPAADAGAAEDSALLQRQMEEAEQRMEEMRRSFDEQLRQAQSSAAHVEQNVMQHKKRDEMAHLLNLHEDDRMTMILAFFFDAPTTRICRPEAPNPPAKTDIVLSGIMIEPDHGVVTLDAATGVHTVTPATPTARIFHNGLLISGPTPLAHFDRLQFGASMCFLFVDPQTRGDRRDPVAEGLDWRSAQVELNEKALKSLVPLRPLDPEEAERAERKVREIEERLAREKEEAARQQAEKEALFQKRMAELAAQQQQELEDARRAVAESLTKQQQQQLAQDLAAKEASFRDMSDRMQREFAERQAALERQQAELQDRLKQQMDENVKLMQRKESQHREQQILEEKIMRALPALQEANFVSLQLGRGVQLAIKIHTEKAEQGVAGAAAIDRTLVFIQAHHAVSGSEVLWGLEDFLERVCFMREAYHDFLRTKQKPKYPDDESDPFYIDTSIPSEVGEARVYLEPLSYLFDINDQVTLLDPKGAKVGFLTLQIVPLPLEAEADVRSRRASALAAGEDEANIVLFDEHTRLSERIGRGLVLDLHIRRVMGLPPNKNCNTTCVFQFWGDTKPTRTDPPRDGINIELNYYRRIQIDVVTEEFIKFVQEGVLKIEVFAAQTSAPRRAVVEDSSNEDGDSKEDKVDELALLEQLLTSSVQPDFSNASERARRLATTLRSQSAELRQLRDDLRAAQAQQQKDQQRINILQDEIRTLKSTIDGLRKELATKEQQLQQQKQQDNKVSLPGQIISDTPAPPPPPQSSGPIVQNLHFDSLDAARLRVELQQKVEELQKLRAELQTAQANANKSCCTIL